MQQFLESNQPEPVYPLPTTAIAGASILRANLTSHPVRTVHLMSANQPSHSPNPTEVDSGTLPCSPLCQGSHPHRFRATTSPGGRLYGYRKERSSVHRSRDADRVHAYSKHLPLRQVTLSNPGGEL